MKPHLTLAHETWKRWVAPGDLVIDATLGNGHDSYFLAQLLQGKGRLVGYDIQSSALEQTQKRLQELPIDWRSCISMKLKSHTFFDEQDVKLIVYNLGYLPGGNKEITTLAESTVMSLESGIERLHPQGAISITCYPGHAEGKREQDVVLDYLKRHSSSAWRVSYHIWMDRPDSPMWIWIAKPGQAS